MSCGPPVLWLSTNAIQVFLRLRRSLFRSSFEFIFPFVKLFRFSFVPLFCSSDFAVPLSILSFVLLLLSSFKFVRLFRSSSIPLFHSSAILVTLGRWGFPKTKVNFRMFFSSYFSFFWLCLFIYLAPGLWLVWAGSSPGKIKKKRTNVHFFRHSMCVCVCVCVCAARMSCPGSSR